MNQNFTQFAFTDNVKRVQEHYGSSKAYARMETSGDQYHLTELPDDQARIERAVLLKVQAFDWNCPQHITPRYTTHEIAEGVAKLDPDLLKSCCPDDIE